MKIEIVIDTEAELPIIKIDDLLVEGLTQLGFHWEAINQWILLLKVIDKTSNKLITKIIESI